MPSGLSNPGGALASGLQSPCTSTNKQLQNMSTDPKFVELTPDVLKIYNFIKC